MRRALGSLFLLLAAAYVGCSSDRPDRVDPFGNPVTGGSAGSAGLGQAGGPSAGGTPGTGGSGAGGSGTGGSGTGGSGTGTGGSGTGGSGTGGSGAATFDGGIGGGSLTDVTFGYDPPDVVQEACASGTAEAELIPLDMYIILDKSGSMSNSGK